MLAVLLLPGAQSESGWENPPWGVIFRTWGSPVCRLAMKKALATGLLKPR